MEELRPHTPPVALARRVPNRPGRTTGDNSLGFAGMVLSLIAAC